MTPQGDPASSVTAPRQARLPTPPSTCAQVLGFEGQAADSCAVAGPSSVREAELPTPPGTCEEVLGYEGQVAEALRPPGASG